MISTKILLYKSKKKKDGTHPLALRIIKDRKPKYVFFDYIHEKDWDKKRGKVKESHMYSARINNLLVNKLALANNLILEAETKNMPISINQLVEKLKSSPQKNSPTFFDVGQDHINELKELQKLGTLGNNKANFKAFKDYVKFKDIYFQDIDAKFIKKYIAYLKSQNITDITIRNRLSFIRKIFNLAISDYSIDPRLYPFTRNKNEMKNKNKIHIKTPETLKIGLDVDEMILLEKYVTDKNSDFNIDLKAFLLSFYFAGMRVSDLITLKWESITNTRLYYSMRKNGKADSLEIPPKAKAILEYFKQQKEDNKGYVFPYLKKYNVDNPAEIRKGIRTSNKRINTNLKAIAEELKIEKKISMHIARHSFGNISGDKISIRSLQKLYRHSELSTTMGYQANFNHKKTDEALKNVLDF